MHSYHSYLVPLTDLKSQGKPPAHTPWREGETQCQPIADCKSGDTVGHLDDNQLPATSHLTCLGLPDARRRCIHAGPKSSNDAAYIYHRCIIARCLYHCANSDGATAQDQYARAAELVARVQCREGTSKAAQVVNLKAVSELGSEYLPRAE